MARFFINEGDQTIESGKLESYTPPNEFIADLLQAAQDNGGRASAEDDKGQLVTANID